MAALTMANVTFHGNVNVTQGGKASNVKSVNTSTILIKADLTESEC